MSHRPPLPGLLLLLAACGSAPPPASPPPAAPAVAPSPPAAPSVAPSPAAPAAALSPPDLSRAPSGPEGDAIRRGHALVMDTHRELPDHVGNTLSCTNCHLGGGTVADAAPYVGVVDRYPRYRSRSGKIDDLPERINGCMERSMAGTALPVDSPEMQAFVAYMTFLSEGVAGADMPGAGMPRITPPAPPDAARGEALYASKCQSCHQPDGGGLSAPDGKTVFPPLWGEGSYNIGAGMARLHTAAAFVKWNMPLGQGGSLSDQEAYDLAAYFTVQDRPDLAKKHLDWPKGDKPEDARY